MPFFTRVRMAPPSQPCSTLLNLELSATGSRASRNNIQKDRCMSKTYTEAARHPSLYRSPQGTSSRHVAAVYNQAGDDYVAYADGDPERLFCFDGLHGYADRCLWSLIEKKLADLQMAGASSVTIIDAGLRARHLAAPRRNAS